MVHHQLTWKYTKHKLEIRTDNCILLHKYLLFQFHDKNIIIIIISLQAQI
jgi:hypothetical protein